jgi:hypothetical protein
VCHKSHLASAPAAPRIRLLRPALHLTRLTRLAPATAAPPCNAPPTPRKVTVASGCQRRGATELRQAREGVGLRCPLRHSKGLRPRVPLACLPGRSGLLCAPLPFRALRTQEKASGHRLGPKQTGRAAGEGRRVGPDRQASPRSGGDRTGKLHLAQHKFQLLLRIEMAEKSEWSRRLPAFASWTRTSRDL